MGNGSKNGMRAVRGKRNGVVNGVKNGDKTAWETKENRSDIEAAVKVLEDHGFHVTDAREERAISTQTGHVIADSGINPTGAILLRIVAYEATDGE
jgi:hypothetical protein